MPHLETQVTILHGLDDALIPVSQSEKLAEALESAGMLQSYRAFEGMGHNDIVGAGQVQGMILDWTLSLSPG